jgi:hypothetical protein
MSLTDITYFYCYRRTNRAVSFPSFFPPHFVDLGSNVAALPKIDFDFFQNEMENLTEGVRVIRLYPANPDNYKY